MKRLMLTLLSAVFVCAVPVVPAPAQSSHETIATVQPKMVKIFGAGGIRRLHAYASGFLVSPEGHVATVWSHVLDSEEVTVVLDNGRRYQATVLGAEPQLDLAVLKIEAEGLDLPYFDLEAAAQDASPGTRVLAFSNMFKVATGDEPASVLHGVISAKTQLTARRGAFETPYRGEAYIVDAITNNPGSGGGLLTTHDGRLLGMVGKELRNTQTNTWINYAVPLTKLKPVIEDIIEGRYTPVRDRKEEENPDRYDAIDFGVVMVPDVLFRTPAYIDSVLADSPAAKAGLQANDLVLFVNDELIQSVKTLDEKLGFLEAGDTLRIVVRRKDTLVAAEIDVPRKASGE